MTRDLPDPGVEPQSPALAGGFFIPEPPENPLPPPPTPTWALCPGLDPALGLPLQRERVFLPCSAASMFIKGSLLMVSEVLCQTVLPTLDRSPSCKRCYSRVEWGPVHPQLSRCAFRITRRALERGDLGHSHTQLGNRAIKFICFSFHNFQERHDISQVYLITVHFLPVIFWASWLLGTFAK